MIFFFFWTSSLPAQKNGCNFSFPLHYTFTYTNEDADFPAVSNTMIAVIAEDAIQNRRKVSFTYNTDLHFQIETAPGNNPVVSVSFLKQSITGYVQYRKFSMTPAMMPNRVAFGCRIMKKDSSSSFELPETVNRNISVGDTLVLQCQVPHYSCDSDTVMIRHLHLYFDQQALTKFRERVNLVNDYYAAVAILDSLDAEVPEFNPGNLSLYPRYFLFLEEMNKILEIIRKRDFSKRLALDSMDPGGFRIRFNELARFSLSATMSLRENLKNPGIVSFTYPADSLISRFLDRMGRYIRWSMLVSERNSGIYHEFLGSFFRMNAFGNDMELIREIVLKMFPGMDPDSSCAMLSERINKAYSDRAGWMMRNLQYAEALELLNNAGSFREINPYLKKTEDHEIISKAANGIYNSYLGVAEGALHNGMAEMARSYMVRAQDYRKEYNGYVTTDSLFNRVFAEIAADNLSRCDTLFLDSLYPAALQCYREFENGFDSLTISSIHRILKPKMDFCRYKILIREGEKSLAGSDKPEAGRNFFLARQLSQDAKFPPDSLLDSLCRVTYPFYLIYILNSGEGRIWANRLESAGNFADSIAFLQRTTGTGSSRELSDALADYRRKVEKQACWNANEKVEILLLRSQRQRELKDFFLSGSLTDSAVAIANQFSDCGIRLKGIRDTTNRYHEATEFQRMFKQAGQLITLGHPKDAVVAYYDLESYNRSHDIGRFGISIPQMYDFVYNHADAELALQALLFFREKKDPRMAFRYLKLLHIQDYSRKAARDHLEWMGRELALRDFEERPQRDPVELVKEYGGTDNWMKAFRFAYYNQARQLRHRPFYTWLFRKYFP